MCGRRDSFEVAVNWLELRSAQFRSHAFLRDFLIHSRKGHGTEGTGPAAEIAPISKPRSDGDYRLDIIIA